MRLATHFGVNGNDISKTIEYCHALDIKYLCSGYISDDLVSFKEQFAKEGITLSMVEIGWLREDMIFGDAPKKDELNGFFEKVKAIGDAGIEMAHIFSALKSSNNSEWEKIVKFYAELSEYAEKYKVKIANHVGWSSQHIIRDRVTIKKLLDDVPSPYIGVNMCLGCLQIVAPNDITKDIDLTLKTFGERLFLIHSRDIKVEEGDRWIDVAMGQGEINLALFIDALYRSKLDPIILPEHMPKVSDEKHNEVSAAYAIGYIKGMIKQREWIG